MILLRLSILAATGIALVMASSLRAEEPSKPETLTIGSWSGAYGDAQGIALFRPFEKDAGIRIREEFHDGAIETVRDKLDGWDVVDLGHEAAKRLCAEEKLLKLDAGDLEKAADGAAAAEDFVAGGIETCGIANVAWSSVIVFDAGKFEKNAPQRIGDLLDTKRFPGKRALPEGPEYTLELALLADGVPAAEVYKSLETDEGVSRALAVLDRIKDDIVWWNGAREPLRMLADGEVSMALAFNGRAFTAAIVEQQPLGLVWDGAIYDLDYWAVPASSKKQEAARRFIKFATHPQRMSELSRWFPYAPARKSAEVGKHAEVDVDMRDFAPVAGSRLEAALRRDALWWAEHRERLAKRMKDWREAEEAVAHNEAPEKPEAEKHPAELKAEPPKASEEKPEEKKAEDKPSEKSPKPQDKAEEKKPGDAMKPAQQEADKKDEAEKEPAKVEAAANPEDAAKSVGAAKDSEATGAIPDKKEAEKAEKQAEEAKPEEENKTGDSKPDEEKKGEDAAAVSPAADEKPGDKAKADPENPDDKSQAESEKPTENAAVEPAEKPAVKPKRVRRKKRSRPAPVAQDPFRGFSP